MLTVVMVFGWCLACHTWNLILERFKWNAVNYLKCLQVDCIRFFVFETGLLVVQVSSSLLIQEWSWSPYSPASPPWYWEYRYGPPHPAFFWAIFHIPLKSGLYTAFRSDPATSLLSNCWNMFVILRIKIQLSFSQLSQSGPRLSFLSLPTTYLTCWFSCICFELSHLIWNAARSQICLWCWVFQNSLTTIAAQYSLSALSFTTECYICC